MRSLRLLFREVALGMPLLLASVALTPGALAQTQNEYDSKIAALRVKFLTVENSLVDTEQRVACLNQQEAQLASRRKNSEISLGSLRTQDRELKGNIARQQSEYAGFASNLRREKDKLNAMSFELNRLQRENKRQEQLLQECQREKKWDHLFGLACKFDFDLAKTFGQIKSYEGDIAAAKRREKIERDTADNARSQLASSEKKLKEISRHSGEIDDAIRKVEASLVTISRILSEVRALKQPFELVMSDFTVTLNEVKGVNLEENRRRTLGLLSIIEKVADTALKNHTNAITKTEMALGPKWMEACISR